MRDWADFRITDGTAQTDRFAPALEADYFNVDELLFEELLAMSVELAGQFRFYDLNNQPNGHWGELLSADEAVIMAMILSTDLKQAESEFHLRYQGDIPGLARYVIYWAQKIDFWLVRLKRAVHPSGLPLTQKTRNLVREKLAMPMQDVSGLMARLEADSGEPTGWDLARFDSAWGFTQEAVKTSEPPVEAQDRQRLRDAFLALRNTVGYLQGQVPIYLQESLHSAQHPPATGLLMAFVKLYQRAQQRLNRFTQRHLDFYYEQVLQTRSREPVPERIFLAVTKTAGQAVSIPQGSEFTPGKDTDLRQIVFSAEHELRVTDARIADLRSLDLQHDDLISPETDLGYVTRIKTACPPLTNLDRKDPPLAWPLFGTERSLDGAQDAEIGFALASPLLLLREGVRRVELGIQLQDPELSSAAELIEQLGASHDHRESMRLIGRCFSHYLLSGRQWLSGQHKELLIDEIQARLDPGSVRELVRLLEQDRQGLFYLWFRDAFSVHLSSETGWLAIADVLVTPLADGAGTGLRLGFTLGLEAPPIVAVTGSVHGETFPAGLPVLRCTLNNKCNLYPYSLFDGLLIDRLRLEVDVKGVKDILAYNNHGQLDPSKPLQPFGPIPRGNGYFVVGNYETARKRLTALKLNLQWGELPDSSGGFAEHYQDYPGEINNHSFKAEIQALVDGEWRGRQGDEGQQTVRLFDTVGRLGPVHKERVLAVDLVDDLKPMEPVLEQADYVYHLGSRNGFIRLCLREPADAFGHDRYHELLTRILTQNVRLKKPRPVPPAPYTPLLNRITLDYKASAEFRPTPGRAASEHSLLHIQPFGVEAINPEQREEPVGLLPRFAHPGNLYIGLETADPAGPLSLFFHLTEDRELDAPAKPALIAWFYLSSSGWRRLLPQRILGDGTQGFLSSGVVTLDLPQDMVRGGHSMPSDLYWLRVSVDVNPRGSFTCHAILPHVIRLTRLLDEPHSLVRSHPSEAKWQAMAGLPGIEHMAQVGHPLVGSPGESRRQRIIRISERLRHKQRALNPWDYERLVLQRFPEVAKVKCFPHMVCDTREPRPGHVLIVVVPAVDSAVMPGCSRLTFSSLQLNRIRDFLAGIAPPFVRLRVRNPAYEQIQVRCTVKFVESLDSGAFHKRLDGDISEFICPWSDRGYRARFGWTIRQKDIEARLRELDYVEFVTNFSMLHITRDAAGRYNLGDTAKGGVTDKVSIDPKYPWSLAVPSQHHFIETMPKARTIQAEVTGIDELEIGQTFIIKGNLGHGEEE